MAKLTTLNGLIPEPDGQQPQGDNWLGQFKDILQNVKEIGQMYGAMNKAKAAVKESEAAGGGAGITKENIIKFLEVLCQNGMDSTTIGQLLTKLQPVTLKQALEFLKNAH